VAGVAIVRRPLHVRTAPDGREHGRPQQATDVVLVVAGGAQGRGAVQHGFHGIEGAAAPLRTDRATRGLWTTRAPRRSCGQAGHTDSAGAYTKVAGAAYRS
jgi:hypothetical protein